MLIVALYQELSKSLGKDRVHRDELTLTASAADAGCYARMPALVLKPRDEATVIRAMKILHGRQVPYTFRAAGTSLSGQSVSDSVLLMARGDDWSTCEVLEEGRLVRAGPGITGGRLNQVLAPWKRKFGPDPASINSAMVGGIVANNASGMSCGIHANSYATLRSARIILSDGTLLDSSRPESREAFRKLKPGLVSTLEGIRDRIRAKPELVEKISRKYRIKNTTGYSMNAFLDFDDPVDILLHLMVGSEGTLGFISEAVFSTVPVKAFRASALIYFRDLPSACKAVPLLRRARVPAIEIMDRQALHAVEGQPGIPEILKGLGEGVTALLIDLDAEEQGELDRMIRETEKVLGAFDLVHDFEVTRDPVQIAAYWNVREGVFPSVGGMRPPGTSVIIEDVAVHMEHLTEAVEDMRRMLDDLGYRDAVIYGHVLDGNLHFIFAQDFQRKEEVEKYAHMIESLTRLIVDRYGGSLKAEHGTGINMAPFVRYEWGDELYGMMKEIKYAFDPEGLLNPHVIISDDPGIHLKGFKTMPPVDESVDSCIECGFCEINCLSSGFTLSARQRIVVQREIRRLKEGGGSRKQVNRLARAFRYAGDASCAGDGLCSLSCPLDIDTGILVREMRASARASRRRSQWMARWTAGHFRTVHALAGFGLGAAALAGRILPLKKIWIWDRNMPRPVRSARVAVPSPEDRAMKVVYFPSCISQSMGTSVKDREERPLVRVTLEVLEKAGYQVIFPEGMERLCCGTPWESKGFKDIADAKSRELEAALLAASEQGSIPVLCDTSPCTHRMRSAMQDRLMIKEPVEFIHDHLLGRLELQKLPGRHAFHVTCTSTRMGLEEKFRKVAEACTEEAVFPEEVGCCGFAGDKGFTLPALNRWSLRKLRPQVDGLSSGYSNSRTCEIGLSRHSGIDYRSVMYLVDACMKP